MFDATGLVVMVKVAVVALAATVTLAGAWAAAVLLLDRVTMAPPAEPPRPSRWALTVGVTTAKSAQHFFQQSGILRTLWTQTFITKDSLASFGKMPFFEDAGST